MTDDRSSLSAAVRARALALGFDAVGIVAAADSAHGDAYRRWIAQDFHGSMGYLARPDAVERRESVAAAVPGARSAVVVAMDYFPGGPASDSDVGPDRAIFARYARNKDYHELMVERLRQLQDWIAEHAGGASGRAYVDTGPVLEREVANRAGIAWFGRNTMAIRPQRGSYCFLGTLVVDVDLEPDAPLDEEFCGSCSRCLSACPTGALLGRDESGAPIMDARRCISYLTIEQKGPVPREFRRAIGNRIYGCDICQEVCPHNNPKFVQITDEAEFLPREGVQGVTLIELMSLSQEEFSARFRGSPVKRAKRRGLLRNVAIGLGNWGSVEAVLVLAGSLDDDEELIRGHAAWALGEIGRRNEGAAEMISARLQDRLAREDSDSVREELSFALEALVGS